MLSIEQLRKADPELNNLSDEEILKIRDSFYELGALIFDNWVETEGGSKYPVGVLHKLQEGNILKPWDKREQKRG